jgi:hypothetical protein
VPGSAGFLVLSTGYLGNGERLWSEETLYRGDAYEFHTGLGLSRAPERPLERWSTWGDHASER